MSNNDDRVIATPSGDKFTGSILILSRRFYLMTTNSGNEKTKAEYSDLRHVFISDFKEEMFLVLYIIRLKLITFYVFLITWNIKRVDLDGDLFLRPEDFAQRQCQI